MVNTTFNSSASHFSTSAHLCSLRIPSHPRDRSSARGTCRFACGRAGSPRTPVEWFFQARVCKHHLGILLKYRFWFSRSGGTPKVLQLRHAPKWCQYEDTVWRAKVQQSSHGRVPESRSEPWRFRNIIYVGTLSKSSLLCGWLTLTKFTRVMNTGREARNGPK